MHRLRKIGYVSIETVIVAAIILAAGLFGVLGLSGTGGQLVRNGIDKLEDLGVFPGGGNNGGGNDFTYDENGYPSDLDVKPGDITPVDEFQFQLNNEEDGYILVRYNGGSSRLVIPREYEGLPVKELGDYSLQLWNISQPLESIVLPNSIEVIGNSALQRSNLTDLIIPGSVTKIGEDVFSNSSLTHVTFMGDVPSNLGLYIFSNNNGLTARTILVPDSQLQSYKNIARSNFDVDTVAIYSSSSAPISPGAPLDESGYPAELGIRPEDISAEDDFSFSWDSIYKGWEITGYSGTRTDIVIPKTRASTGEPIVSIGNSAFLFYSWLDFKITSVAIPNSIKAIRYAAFQDNPIESVIIPDSVVIIEEYAFAWNELTSLHLPKGTIVKNMAFNDNRLPDSQAYIYSNGLDRRFLVSYGGESKTPVIPSGTVEIDYLVFIGLDLISVDIPNSVEIIGERAFENNELTSVKLPSSLKYIGQSAFKNNKLSTLTIPEGVRTIERDTFLNNLIESVVLPSSVVSVKRGAFNRNLLPNAQAYFYNDMDTKTFLTSYGGASKYPFIPEGVTRIDDSTFSGLGLSTATLPDSLIYIGQYAFSGNNLSSVILPDGLTTIVGGAFTGNKITNLVIPASVTTLGAWAFENNMLTSVKFMGARPTDLPSGSNWGVFRGNPTLVANSVSVPNTHLQSYRNVASTAFSLSWTHFKGH